MSPTTAMFWPMIGHAALIFGLYILLFLRRREYTFIDAESVRRYRDAGEEAPESRLVSRNLANQFELPVLFYAASLLLYITDADNIATIILGWIFVVSRYVHSYIHVTSNRLRHRALAFAVGAISLILMWSWLALWLALE